MTSRNLNEPEDQAVEGANKLAAGCGLVVVAVPLIGLIVWGVGILFGWW